METKLTLRLDKDVIEMAKNYASNQHISLSKLIESYLELITKKGTQEIEISPLVESLSGVINSKSGKDYKKDYTDFLTEKYK